jgi:hypothetical protein
VPRLAADVTPTEAARLQGIPPETFIRAGVDDRAAYKQLGNGVNVGVVTLVARVLMKRNWPPMPKTSAPTSKRWVATSGNATLFD